MIPIMGSRMDLIRKGRWQSRTKTSRRQYFRGGCFATLTWKWLSCSTFHCGLHFKEHVPLGITSTPQIARFYCIDWSIVNNQEFIIMIKPSFLWTPTNFNKWEDHGKADYHKSNDPQRISQIIIFIPSFSLFLVSQWRTSVDRPLFSPSIVDKRFWNVWLQFWALVELMIALASKFFQFLDTQIKEQGGQQLVS